MSVTLLTGRSMHTTGHKQQIDQQTAVFEGRYVESDAVTKQQKKAHHQAEVEDAANDIKARVFEAEEVQVLAAQLHAAGGGGVGRCTMVLPASPQLCFLILLSFHCCCTQCANHQQAVVTVSAFQMLFC